MVDASAALLDLPENLRNQSANIRICKPGMPSEATSTPCGGSYRKEPKTHNEEFLLHHTARPDTIRGVPVLLKVDGIRASSLTLNPKP